MLFWNILISMSILDIWQDFSGNFESYLHNKMWTKRYFENHYSKEFFPNLQKWKLVWRNNTTNKQSVTKLLGINWHREEREGSHVIHGKSNVVWTSWSTAEAIYAIHWIVHFQWNLKTTLVKHLFRRVWAFFILLHLHIFGAGDPLAF